jgi:pimeloyl-ACP methyl ester carboxylesterase
VFIVGLSIGGVEAPLIEREEKVRGVVVINTAAKPFMEYWLETSRRQKLLAGNPHDRVDAEMAVSLRCNYALLVERQSPEQILQRSPECKDEITFPAPYTFMQQWAALNVGEAWKRVDAPVLVVVGKSDYVATVAESPYLVDMLNAYRPGRATLVEIEGMDHFMTKAPSMRASQERMEKPGTPAEFNPMVLDTTVDWLRKQSGRG